MPELGPRLYLANPVRFVFASPSKSSTASFHTVQVRRGVEAPLAFSAVNRYSLVLCLVWVHRALNGTKRRFSARAGVWGRRAVSDIAHPGVAAAARLDEGRTAILRCHFRFLYGFSI
jgi:hypothetical protein